MFHRMVKRTHSRVEVYKIPSGYFWLAHFGELIHSQKCLTWEHETGLRDAHGSSQHPRTDSQATITGIPNVPPERETFKIYAIDSSAVRFPPVIPHWL